MDEESSKTDMPQNEGETVLSKITNQKLFFEALVQNIPIAVVTLDEGDRIINCNPAFESLFGHQMAEVQGELLDGLITTEHTVIEAKEYTRSVQDGETVRKIGLRKRKDGSEVEVDIFGVPVMLHGEQIGSLAIYLNLTEQRKIEEQLRESRDKLQVIASIDPLTGILNRRAITEQIQIETNRAAREGKSMGLMLIDLDNLKKINDVNGHLAGDAALQKIADIITSVSRVYDRAGRWGGDEFMLSLVNVKEKEGLLIANRILENSRNAKLVVDQVEIPLSVSIGITCFDPRENPAGNLDHHFSIADKALYEAKSAGRDQVKFVSGK